MTLESSPNVWLEKMEVGGLSWHWSKILAGVIGQRSRWLIWTIFMLKIRCTCYSHATTPPPSNSTSGTLLHSINQQHICNPPTFCIISSSSSSLCVCVCVCFLMYGYDSQLKHHSGLGVAVTRQHLPHLIHIHPSLREPEVDPDSFRFQLKD